MDSLSDYAMVRNLTAFVGAFPKIVVDVFSGASNYVISITIQYPSLSDLYPAMELLMAIILPIIAAIFCPLPKRRTIGPQEVAHTFVAAVAATCIVTLLRWLLLDLGYGGDDTSTSSLKLPLGLMLLLATLLSGKDSDASAKFYVSMLVGLIYLANLSDLQQMVSAPIVYYMSIGSNRLENVPTAICQSVLCALAQIVLGSEKDLIKISPLLHVVNPTGHESYSVSPLDVVIPGLVMSLLWQAGDFLYCSVSMIAYAGAGLLCLKDVGAILPRWSLPLVAVFSPMTLAAVKGDVSKLYRYQARDWQ